MEKQTEINRNRTTRPYGASRPTDIGRVTDIPAAEPRRIFNGGIVSADEATRLRVITGGTLKRKGSQIPVEGIAPGASHLSDRTQRSLQTLAAGIAHHYNNLIMGIQGYLTLLRSRDARLNTHAGKRLSEIQKLIQSGSCFPVHLLEYLRNELYEDRHRSTLSQIVYFYPIDGGAADTHKLDTERRMFFTRLNTATDSRFISVLVGGICRNYDRMFKRMQKQLVLLAKDLTTSASTRHCYFGMWRLVVRALKTTHQLSTYAAETPKYTRLVSVHNELAACCHDFACRHPTARIHRYFYPDEIQVRANPEQLKGIFDAVLENAMDAMPDGGDIRVETHLVRTLENGRSESPDAGHYLTVEIQDSGEGIAESTLDRVCDPFFTTKPETKHQGLGLASVHGGVNAMSGILWVESDPGRGTRLTICLPAWSVVRHEVQPMVLPDGTPRDVSSEIVTLVQSPGEAFHA